MPLDTHIKDGTGSDRLAHVDPDHALFTIAAPRPPLPGEMLGSQPMRVFRQHLTTDGLATDGSNQDMLVDGSSTNVDFYVPADTTRDRYISILSFVIADASQVLNEFGNTNNPLTNGCRLFYEDADGEIDIHDSLTTNFEFIRLCCTGMPPVGQQANAFLANNVASTSEGYIPFLDLRQTFGFQWGVRLAAATNQRIVMTIRDDCTGPDQFDCIAYGFEITS